MAYKEESFFYSQNEQQQHNNQFEEIKSIMKMQQENKNKNCNQGQVGRKRGRPRKQQEQNIIKNQNSELYSSRFSPAISINRYTFHQIYFENCQKIQLLYYKPLNANEQSFLSWAFTEIIEQLKYRQSIQQKSISNAKLRSLIIRKALQDYIKYLFPDSQKKQSQRITAFDKKYYEQAQIEIPTSILNIDYINNLFKNTKFKEFYIGYYKTNKIKDFYLRKCYDQVSYYCEQIESISKSLHNILNKEMQLKKLKKPITLIQVKQYEEQASNIYNQYCQ